MPLYEYQCQKCGHRFEKIKKFSDPPEKKCPECGGKVQQLISAPAVQFKGTGWYVTDYAKKGSSGGHKKGEKAEASADKPSSDSTSKPADSDSKPTGSKSSKKESKKD